MLRLLVPILLLASVLSSPILLDDASTCKVCHPLDPNKINVHLIPHSHNDAGNHKTVDQYYYGSRTDITRAGVQYILSSVVVALKANPERRYVQTETTYFWKWWNYQTDATKQDFIDLVNNGQIEIVNGAWSMNDEATNNYQAIIDQFTWGLRAINDSVGECGVPKIGWPIDTFGHSREQASLYRQFGYNGIFFARLDHNDKSKRKNDQNMEFIWQTSANLENNNIFTSIFDDHYYAPDGFCYDVNCGDEVITDDERSQDYNVPRKVQDFADRILPIANYHKTSNIIVPIGGDFQFQSAEKNFINFDKLLLGFKNHDQLNVFYSTPSCYLEAVNNEVTGENIDLTTKVDDFFPYSTDDTTFWAGLYTSRPSNKYLTQIGNNLLQAGKQLVSFAKVHGNDYETSLDPLRRAMGIMQHHHAVTGTAKQAVISEYLRALSSAIEKTGTAIGDALKQILQKDGTNVLNLNLNLCLLSNISVCETAKSSRFVVVDYNPLDREVTHFVRLPVPDGTYRVQGPAGEKDYDLLDSISNFDYVKDVGGTPSPKELIFISHLSPLGSKLYYVERTGSKSSEVKPSPKKVKFGTSKTGFEIDTDSGLLKSVTMNGKTLSITQQLLYYNGANNDDHRVSGAFVFAPRETQASTFSDRVSYETISGTYVDEVRQVFNDWVTQIIRVYKEDTHNYIEFDWLVGPIEVDESKLIGREVISRFSVNDFNNGEVFYTDSNGRELIERQLNKRYDYDYDAAREPVAGNYYPINSKIVIKDEEKKLRVAVLTDRTQGGSSLENGRIELMVHRRLLMDDFKGLNEALNEQEFDQGLVARGRHYLVIGSSEASGTGDSTAAQERDLALKKHLAPLVLVGDASSGDLSYDAILSSYQNMFDGLNTALPLNTHILTLEPWKDDTLLLRLEHILEKGEDTTLSQPTTVDLSGLFKLFDIIEIKETILGGNQWLDKFEAKKKLIWKASDIREIKYEKSAVDAANLEISLNPMQIRTFIVKVVKK